MFEVDNIENILSSCEKRKNILSDTNKLSINDKDYLSFITTYNGCEITPDIKIFGYEESLNANRYIQEEYPDVAEKIWLIGCTGIGDQWFLDKESHSILFFDHDQGEYTNAEFTDLEVQFNDFFRMSFVLRSLEDFLDDNTSFDQDKVEKEFKVEMNKISPKLYERYPYNWM